MFHRVFVCIFSFLSVCLIVRAQETVNYASVSGRVADPTGGVIRDAQVTARHVATNVTNTAKTDGEGRFRFPYLNVGTYEIKVRHGGFTDFAQSLTVTVGSAFEMPITLAWRQRKRTSRLLATRSSSKPRARRSPAPFRSMRCRICR